MSLDKAIQSGKEHRKPYIGCKSIDKTCRNHGGCGWCLENRLIQKLRKEEAMRMDEEEWEEEDDE